MTLDQSCPLCGEKLEGDYDQYGCVNIYCFCGADSVIFSKVDIDRLNCQLETIKQKAKQELMNEFDAEFEVMENEATDEENYCIVTYAYDRIKKKHGVD